MKRLQMNWPLKPAAIAVLGVAFFSIVGVVLFVPMSSAADDKKATTPKPALTVTTAQASRARLPIKLAANGNIVAAPSPIPSRVSISRREIRCMFPPPVSSSARASPGVFQIFQ